VKCCLGAWERSFFERRNLFASSPIYHRNEGMTNVSAQGNVPLLFSATTARIDFSASLAGARVLTIARNAAATELGKGSKAGRWQCTACAEAAHSKNGEKTEGKSRRLKVRKGITDSKTAESFVSDHLSKKITNVQERQESHDGILFILSELSASAQFMLGEGTQEDHKGGERCCLTIN
jgi:predicted secreted protein